MTWRFLQTCRVGVVAAVTMACLEVAWADTVLVVDTVADDAAATACLDAVPDDCSLRGAITNANALPLVEVATIQVPNAEYVLSINGPGEDANQTGDLDVLRSLTIEGGLTVLTDIGGGGPGGLNDGLLHVHGAGTVLVVRDLTFEENQPGFDRHAITLNPDVTLRLARVYVEGCGHLTDGGGGIRVGEGASASVSGSRVWYNAGFEGAGIVVEGGSAFVFQSRASNNAAAVHGGGIAVLGIPPVSAVGVTVQESDILSNTSVQGGGIWVGEGTQLLVQDSYLEGNQATIGPMVDRLGGGVYSNGPVEITGTTISGGAAVLGIAIAVEDSGDGLAQLDLVNSTVSATAVDPGDVAIVIDGASAELLFVTMADNSLDVYTTASTLTIGASLFEGGCLQGGGTTIQSNGDNIGLGSSCWVGAPGPGDLVVADLMLAPLAWVGGESLVHLPQSTSPVLDHVSGPCLALDQRGFTRPAVGCDSGSVERLPLEAIFLDDFESGDTSAWTVTP